MCSRGNNADNLLWFTFDSHAESWPPFFQIVPTPDGMPLNELTPWMKRHQPTLCTIQLQTVGVPDVKVNSNNYASLVEMLYTRKQVSTHIRLGYISLAHI